MNEKLGISLTLIAYSVLVWGAITSSIARAIIGIGLLFLVGLDTSGGAKK